MLKAWRNTTVRFGLVTVPVAVAPAKTDKMSVAAHRYSEDGQRAKQAWTVDGETILAETKMLYDVDGEPVEIVPPELDGDKGIDLQAFAPTAGIDPLLYDSAYCVFPAKGSGKALGAIAKLLRDNPAMVLAGTARFTDRPRSVVLRWSEAAGAIVLHTLAYTARVRFAEMRAASEALEDPDAVTLAQGETLVASLPAEYSPADTDPMEGAIIEALLRARPSAESAIPDLVTTNADILATLRADMQRAAEAKDSAETGAAAVHQTTKTTTRGGRKPKAKA
jgi:non-homologous end joining protein Ku